VKLIEKHSDERGKIFLLADDLGNLSEITIFLTNRGYARGGCIHKDSDEHTCVIKGAVLYNLGNDPLKDEPKVLIEGQSMKIPKNTPHYFFALEDSIVLEWGPKPSEKKEKHEETRRIVEFLNAMRKK